MNCLRLNKTLKSSKPFIGSKWYNRYCFRGKHGRVCRDDVGFEGFITVRGKMLVIWKTNQIKWK